MPVTWDTGHAVGPFSTSVSIVGDARIDKDFALTPGQSYTFKVWLGSGHEFNWIGGGFTLTSGASTAGAGRNGDTPDVRLSATITADETGVVHWRAHTSSFFGFVNTYFFAGCRIDGGRCATVGFRA